MTYYEKLYKINQLVCKDEAKLRTQDFQHLAVIDQAINEALNETDYKRILHKATKVASLIKLYQPFVDGNNRTGLIAFNIIITKKGIAFNLKEAFKDLKNNNFSIPTIYDSNDLVFIPKSWLKYLKKEKNHEGSKYYIHLHKSY